MRLILYYFLSILLISSCGIMHNVPESKNPNRQIPPNTTIAFVDQHGIFYPNDWGQVYGLPPDDARKNAFSLSKLADEKKIGNDLKKFEKNYLAQLKKHLASKKRVFVLIHGFNASERKVTRVYEQLQKKLAVSKNDEVIQFYWDGLYTNNPFSGIKTWFNASDYSQYAGKFALRKIINTMNNKDIYLISHSRGASVILSALSTAKLDSAKMNAIYENYGLDTANNDHFLYNRNNRIVAISLGPAIGKSDFEIKNDKDTIEYVSFTPQLKSFHITTNKNDIILKKYIGLLTNKLNPTDLGYKGNSYQELAKEFKILNMTDFSGQKSHGFSQYINNSKFKEILKKYNIKSVK